MAGNLDKIEHIVVLMLENRSFDNVLGWLYGPNNQAPFLNRPPRDQPYEGLWGNEYRNPIPPGAPDAERKFVYAAQETNWDSPNPDPGEEYEHVNIQLFGQNPPPIPPDPTMQGFVQDYVNVLTAQASGDAPNFAQYSPIMNGYPPAMVPVISMLAQSYAVCDQYHCSVPSQTMCNRSFAGAATSAGIVNNEPYTQWLRNTGDTVFNRLQGAGEPWRIYFHADDDPVSLTWLIHRSLWLYHGSHICNINQFYDDAAEGTLPAYAFLEPRFLIAPNDQHPPYGMLPGEQLIADVYNALRTSPQWEQTLLIITYDEHGGCFDHVPPPAARPPMDGAACPQSFTFDRLGVRVPCVLVSPWIEAGTVFRAGAPLDHTAIIRTVSNKWGLGNLTERDAHALDFSGVLTLDAPRRDQPNVNPLPYVRPVAPHLELASGLHLAMTGMVAALDAESTMARVREELVTVADAHSLISDAVARISHKRP
jgi:phospholipase C